jgi:hypothetical protein
MPLGRQRGGCEAVFGIDPDSADGRLEQPACAIHVYSTGAGSGGYVGTGGGPNDVAVVYGLSITGSVPNGMVRQFICSANVSDGQFTVPADVMANIPATGLPVAGPRAGIAVGSFSNARFTASGLDLGYVLSLVTATQYLVFQ